MYIPTDIYGCVGSSLEPVFQELSKTKREYSYIYPDMDETLSPKNKKVLIGVLVGVFVVALLLLSPWIYEGIVKLIRNIKQKRRHKRLDKEKKKAVQPLLVASEISRESNSNDPISNSKNDSETTEPARPQSIEKPSTALLSSKNSFQSSQRTSYEYEPLPPYDIVQARDITENV